MNDITNWWDLSTEEKAQLTEDQVRDYCRVAAMEAGCVLTPLDPEFLPEDMPSMQRVKMYTASGDYLPDGIAFATREDAEAFAGLQVLGIERKYLGSGYANTVSVIRPLTGIQVKTNEDGITEDEYHRARVKLDEYGENAKHNAQLRAALDKRERKYTEATRDLWADYREAKARAAKLAEVRTCWDEFKQLAKDEASAIVFMEKAYSDDAELLKEALGEAWNVEVMDA